MKVISFGSLVSKCWTKKEIEMKKILVALMFVVLTISSCIPNDEVTTKCFEAGRYVSCNLSAPRTTF